MKRMKKPALPVRDLERKVTYGVPDRISTKKLYEMYPAGTLFCEYNYDGSEYYIEQVKPETEEEFERRFDEYAVELEKYNTWYGVNKNAIQLEEELKKKKELEKKEKERAKLLSQLDVLQRQLEELH